MSKNLDNFVAARNMADLVARFDMLDLALNGAGFALGGYNDTEIKELRAAFGDAAKSLRDIHRKLKVRLNDLHNAAVVADCQE